VWRRQHVRGRFGNAVPLRSSSGNHTVPIFGLVQSSKESQCSCLSSRDVPPLPWSRLALPGTLSPLVVDDVLWLRSLHVYGVFPWPPTLLLTPPLFLDDALYGTSCALGRIRAHLLFGGVCRLDGYHLNRRRAVGIPGPKKIRTCKDNSRCGDVSQDVNTEDLDAHSLDISRRPHPWASMNAQDWTGSGYVSETRPLGNQRTSKTWTGCIPTLGIVQTKPLGNE
jgi:hypothetical protein